MNSSFPSLTNFLTAARGVAVWQFALEILAIGAVVYWVIRFLQGTRGVRVLKGIVVLLITLYLGVRVLAGFFDLARLDVLFGRFLFYASFAAIIVFQPELRRALMRLGETRLFRGRVGGSDEVDELVKACATLSRRRVGALVALERDDSLASYAEEATRLDAEVSAPLLTTIFHPNTALHDLGVVMRDGRLAFAGVQFPLAESGDLPKELGSRHRAAVGLSAETDAIVVAVSEETGDMSIAESGRLHRKIPAERLGTMLQELLTRSVATALKPISDPPAVERPKSPARPPAKPTPVPPAEVVNPETLPRASEPRDVAPARAASTRKPAVAEVS